MKYYSGEGLLNSTINSLPFEIHIPGYNWCGPGTKVAERLARNDSGINGLDEACKEHDIFYSQDNNLTNRHKADQILAKKAMKRFKASDASWKEKLAALGVAGAMKAKVKLGMGFKENKNIVFKNLQKIKQDLESALYLTKELVQNMQITSNSNGNAKNGIKTLNKRKQPNTTVGKEKKKKVSAEDIPNYHMKKIQEKIKEKIQKKIRNKTSKNKKKSHESSLSDMEMDVDNKNNHPLINNISNNGSSKVKRKATSNDLNYQTKRRKIDMNEEIILPSNYKRKRKLNNDDDDESEIPQKVQVINAE